MKSIRSLSLSFALALAAVSAPAAENHQDHNHDKSPATALTGLLVAVTPQTDAQWLAQARAAYPLESCMISGDKFDGGAMGKPQDYIYQVPGQTDRLVRFCCNDCVKDFNKDPAPALAKIDAAAAAKAKK